MAKLRAAECREFIKAVVEKADDMGVPISVAVVGPEGHLIAVERMDEAGFITPDTAIAKALYRRRVPLDEPALSRRAGDPAMVQGAQSAIADRPVGADQWQDRGLRRRRAGVQGQ